MSELVMFYQERNVYQQTIRVQRPISGDSAFTQNKAQITLLPAEVNSGILFKVGKTIIPATAEYLFEDPNYSHTTILKKDGVRVVTVEHLLASIFGLGISNLIVSTLENGQIPFGDGSSELFTNKILEAGIVKQKAHQKKIHIMKPFELKIDESWIRLLPMPLGPLKIDATIEFPLPIGIQEFRYVHSSDYFCHNISRARSFAFNPFRKKGITKKKLPAFYFNKGSFNDSNMLIYRKDGNYLVSLRYQNEAVRHKILDFLGDLALLGGELVAMVFLYKSGHGTTHEFVKKVRRLLCQSKNQALALG